MWVIVRHKARGDQREPLVQIKEEFRAHGMGDRLRWATREEEEEDSVSAPLIGFESHLSPTSVGSDLLIDSVQGFRR
jgi:hypothetical protein